MIFKQKGDTLGERIMSCFGCCKDDDINRPTDGGGAYMVKNSAGNLTWVVSVYLAYITRQKYDLIFLT